MRVSLYLFRYSIIFLLISGFFYYVLEPPKHSDHWQSSHRFITTRELANNDFEKQNDLKVYEDYFVTESFNERFKYDVRYRIWTDKDLEYIKDKLSMTIKTSFAETFFQLSKNYDSNTQDQKKFLPLFKEEVTQQFLLNFVKTLKFHKIMNGTFQVDFDFYPVDNYPDNFHYELSTNQLINLGEQNNLMQKLTQDSKYVDLNKIILASNLPDAQTTTYQYTGGTISLWFKILDLNWDLSKPIPSTRKNAIKGYVRYRRFFKSHLPERISLNKKSKKKTTVDSLIVKKDLDKPLFLTVDFYKNFNLASPIPKSEKIEIFFGKLLSSNVERTGLINDVFRKEKEHINSGSLSINGKVSFLGKELSYISKVNKLTYLFEEQEFSDESDIETVTLKNIPLIRNNLANKVNRELLNTFSQTLIDSLQLTKFHDKMRGGDE